jgi:translation initiation factor IF-3
MEVRLVGDNVEPAVYSLREALRIAKIQDLDLVEISNKADLPICKIIDYAKFKYEQKRKDKQLKANAQKSVLKEIRLRTMTDTHDFEFKTRHALNFLKEGAKVRVTVQFNRRETQESRIAYFKDNAKLKLLSMATAVEEYGKIEEMPKMEGGRRMMLMIVPKSNRKKK